MSVLLRGGRVVDPASGTDETLDVLIVDGKIDSIGHGISAEGAQVIDVDGAIVAPGFVDTHAHLREPGREDEETIESGSKAAALGGFTAVCAMPNTDPVCDNSAIAEKVVSGARLTGFVEVLPAGAITRGLEGKNLAAIGEMARSSARVRLFTDDGKGVQDARLLRRAMEYIRAFDGVCAEHCEDASLAADGQMNEGEFSELLGLNGIPAEAEEIALGRDLALARLTGVRFHALHVSTAGSADLIRVAKAQGLRVTAEVTPHHLSLTEAELVSYDPVFKVNPPLRSTADVDALREALADGTIDAIATDHAPHSAEEKEAEFEIAPSGMLGLQTALAVAITNLVEPGLISLTRLIEVMSVNPARILGLDGHGGPIEPGGIANLTVFDPSTVWTVDPNEMASLSRNTPWAGRTLSGMVIHTFFQGRQTVFDGKIRDEVYA